MKQCILGFLRCPCCRGELKLEVFDSEEREVKEGILYCPALHWFPIYNFVPRILGATARADYKMFILKWKNKMADFHIKIEEGDIVRRNKDVSRDILQTQGSFGNKWNSQPFWGILGETRSFMREWILTKYGWGDERGFRKAIADKKTILDAGTGLGRDAINFAFGNPDALIFGVELSDCVEHSYKNTVDYPNIHIIQADIMNLPFKEGIFDLIFSEGVLHHTPDTKKAFNGLIPYVSVQGEIAIYVYCKKGPIREFCDDYIRAYTTELSAEECWKFCEGITNLGKILTDIKIEFEVPEDIPLLHIKTGRYDLQRFIYYNILKCFWNERFSFKENNLINFDWYHPPYAWRHDPKEVEDWFKENGLMIAHKNVEESGITMRGIKRQA